MTITTANKSPTTITANSVADSGSARGSFSENDAWIDHAYCVYSDFPSLLVFLVREKSAEGLESILKTLIKKQAVHRKIK